MLSTWSTAATILGSPTCCLSTVPAGSLPLFPAAVVLLTNSRQCTDITASAPNEEAGYIGCVPALHVVYALERLVDYVIWTLSSSLQASWQYTGHNRNAKSSLNRPIRGSHRPLHSGLPRS